MSNKKQSSIEWLVDQIEKDANVRLRGLNLNNLLEQAKAMHKEEIVNARQSGIDATINGRSISNIDYYKETFGGNNE